MAIYAPHEPGHIDKQQLSVREHQQLRLYHDFYLHHNGVHYAGE